jgi:8-amino-7-oxononanoate synthase
MKMLPQLDWANEKLETLKSKNLYRELRVLERLKGTHATIAGKDVTLFCGNDYLGLSRHPEVAQAAERALKTWGVGAGSARLIAGTTSLHDALEKRIADFLGKESAILFSSGYLANLGALSALTDEDDLIVLDKLSHASLIDAARASKAQVRVFPHRNLQYLERILKSFRQRHPERSEGYPTLSLRDSGPNEVEAIPGPEIASSPTAPRNDSCKRGPQDDGGRIWIVTDSVFSMDGDLAPLEALCDLKDRYDAQLVIDEAHGTGVFGARGCGVSEALGVTDRVDLHIGTCSKALGGLGGFVAGRSAFIETIINEARSFIFDTALPPMLCASSMEALNLIEGRSEIRERLWCNARSLRKALQVLGIPVLEGDSPIIPIVIGDEKQTLEAADFLLKEGFLAPAVRFPTVPKGKARLRVTVSSLHTEAEIKEFSKAAGKVLHS